MILKGNSRGGAKDLALHLMKEENEHIEVHELRSFASHTLMGALNEVYAASRGTRCKQFLYSLSLNPPKHARVTTEQFEAAIERVEERLRLSGQSRAIVFHEKEGRRHAHCVWSRNKTVEMKAVQMSYDHKKLVSVSRELFLEHGWPMPEGLADASKGEPKNFTYEQWQQAKRVGKDARATKTAFLDAWAVSDSKTAFIHAMRERGYVVAQGDRCGFVGVDVHGEVYSIPRNAGVKTKAVRERLEDEKALPSVDEAKRGIARDMLHAFKRFKDELDVLAQAQDSVFEERRKSLVQRQQAERQSLSEVQAERRMEAMRLRQARFRKGLKGLWDRVCGQQQRIRRQNKAEAGDALARDQMEKDELAFQHLEERRQIEAFRLRFRHQHVRDRTKLERDTWHYMQMELDTAAKPEKPPRSKSRSRGPSPEH